MVVVRWLDGGRMSAWNWRALFDRAKRVQWSHYGDREFREQMAQRARVWSNSTVRTEQNFRAFFEDLQAAGLLRIIEAEKDAPPPPLAFPPRSDFSQSTTR